MGGLKADVIGLDWAVDITAARQSLGQRTIQGNVDPMILFGTEDNISAAVRDVIAKAGPHHILNVGHGVVQGTPEENVGLFVNLARESGNAVPQTEPQLVA